MPKYLDIIEANKFQTAHESDIFPLPIVAIALGIGRNKMSQIPVIPLMIDKRKCYRKSEILDWAIAEQTKGKDNLLLKLRAENSSIGRYEKAWSKAYDQSTYYGVNGIDERGRPDLQIERLLDELNELEREFAYNDWPESADKVSCRDLAVMTLNRLLELKNKCNYHQKKELEIFKSRWWYIENDEKRAEAHKLFFEDNEREDISEMQDDFDEVVFLKNLNQNSVK